MKLKPFWISILFLLPVFVFGQQKNRKTKTEKETPYFLNHGLKPGFEPDSIFRFALRQYSKATQHFFDTTKAIRTCDSTGKWTTIPKDDWMSGFFPGILWYIYENTQDPGIGSEARKWTQSLENQKYLTKHHDIGFMMYCSFGNALRLNQKPTDKAILIQSAESALKRYNPIVGTIKSWNFKPKDHPTIIDNMMNLELLTWASKTTGNQKYKDVAIKHAETSIKNHFRPDFSSYHVVLYDSSNGQVIKKHTAQGYSDESRWARGQAWGLYGYVMMFRETGKQEFLKQAINISDLFIKLLPSDTIPFWDFDAPNIPNEVKDASSAAVAASGLLELALLLPDKKQGEKYYNAAVMMLNALSSSKYLATSKNYECVLLHSAYHVPKKYEVDVNISYADYYYLEALSRLKMIRKGAKSVAWF
jgi:unsaturated chondroitin disaccharide hydrolase